jgi:CubicO group peptidase (beta-lactamase class C family)
MRTVAPGYESLETLFDALIADRERGGAALCVYAAGVPVCDVSAGPSFGPHTSVVLFSVTKAITACCVALLLQDGALDLEAPVTCY